MDASRPADEPRAPARPTGDAGDPAPYRLHVLGGADLIGPDGRRISSVVAQPKRLCLLTYLALAPGPVSRAELAALFWPRSDEAHARNALSQALFYLRRSTTKGLVRSVEGDRVLVEPAALRCDARELLCRAAIGPGLARDAPGELLQGWNADDSQPLQEWLDRSRRALRERAADDEGGLRGPRTVPEDGGRAMAATGPPEEVDRPAVGGASRASRSRRVALVALALAVAGATTMRLAWARSGGPSGDSGSATGLAPRVDTIVVLPPTMISLADAPYLLADAIRIEILAELAALPGVVVHAPTLASSPGARGGALTVADYRRQLELIGEPAGRKWFLEVLTIVGRGEARSRAVLHGGGGVAVEPVSQPSGNEHDLFMVVPSRIAEAVGAMVGRRLAVDPDGGAR